MPGDDDSADTEQGPQFTRKWFLVALGGLAAAAFGLDRLLGGGHGSQSEGGSGSGLVGSSSSADGGGSGAAGSAGRDDFPVRTVDAVPRKALRDWVIEVDGLVDRPLRVDHATWRTFPHTEETVDFHCVEGWSVDGVRWGGVRPSALIALAGPHAAATHAVFHADDGEYTDSLSLEQVAGKDTLLADTLDGRPLPADHGGPVRLVVPSQLGYKNVKFVRRIELTSGPVRGYWERFGYPVDAPVES